MSKVIVVGAGPAGLLAGITAAQNGAEVIVIEKMRTPGKKLLITGKGRCNITNSCDIAEMVKNIPGNGRFLHSVLRSFTNADIIELLENSGVPTKVERGGRVFPVSDKAVDVLSALVRLLESYGAQLITDTSVSGLLMQNQTVTGVITSKGNYLADAVVLAAGGASYPAIGSDGSGFQIAQKSGHTIIQPLPALVPIESDSEYIPELQGISLKNVQASICCNNKVLAKEFGEMLFTHFGFSGPIILSLSKIIATHIYKNQESLDLVIDLKPALDAHKLDLRIQRDFNLYSRKQLINAMVDLLPGRLIQPVLDSAFLNPEKIVNQISKEERGRLGHTLKNLSFPITGTRPLREAIVTAGGVATTEINPKTMASKVVDGLFLAGEVIDIDGYTGGYNLQAAYSTGVVAGKNAALLGDIRSCSND
ncbi:MAG TPA: NAD(P)/FAD-dependent oxidoreductase [Candidatus Avacidaminococcus intestinavium]|uniref:NAD(P)/FAD-dependent oxidoreductase n=1 Tax=Candidatus Avacidaminococcus intestinavium TaxID=2840684 RepID=A0A9D1MQT1_9FIRM|nr:NAD(P)/FAD-dependent oxidoreductase [Candidatus Avacidaminococcus intestinavium]